MSITFSSSKSTLHNFQKRSPPRKILTLILIYCEKIWYKVWYLVIRKHCQRQMTKIDSNCLWWNLILAIQILLHCCWTSLQKPFHLDGRCFVRSMLLRLPHTYVTPPSRQRRTRSDGDVGPKWFTDATVHTTHTSIWLNLARYGQTKPILFRDTTVHTAHTSIWLDLAKPNQNYSQTLKYIQPI